MKTTFVNYTLTIDPDLNLDCYIQFNEALNIEQASIKLIQYVTKDESQYAQAFESLTILSEETSTFSLKEGNVTMHFNISKLEYCNRRVFIYVNSDNEIVDVCGLPLGYKYSIKRNDNDGEEEVEEVLDED